MYISVLSARFYMKNIEIEILVDRETYFSLKKSCLEIFNIANIIKVDVDEHYSSKERSRFLKTTMRKYISGDFLFVDCDTVICDDFSGYYNEDPLALVLDSHMPMQNLYNYKSLVMLNKIAGFDISTYKKYYNSGVIWCRDLPEVHHFFLLWHKLWKEHLTEKSCLDQPALNYVNTSLQPLIKELDGEWNCQVSSNPSGLPYLSNAHIIHYFNFNNGPYKLADKDYVYSLSKENIDFIIKKPRSMFVDSSIIAYSSKENRMMSTRVFASMLKLYTKFPNVYFIIECSVTMMYKLKKMFTKLYRNI